MKIGLTLGSGSARGLSHIGVIEALLALGIAPDIICGASMGAFIGAVYCNGTMDQVSAWAQDLDRTSMLSYFDINWRGRGGPVKGEQMMTFLRQYLPDGPIADLPLPFGAVATELSSGDAIWLREGNLIEAVRASAALPGMLTPWPWKDTEGRERWLIDGGVVDPVPVSLCRAMGADVVIAVNLNEFLVKRPFAEPEIAAAAEKKKKKDDSGPLPLLDNFPLVERLPTVLRSGIQGLLTHGPEEPAYLSVVANSVKIMQYQIAHIRLEKEPPDVLLTPHLGDVNLMGFDRAGEVIAEGRATVERAIEQLKPFLP